MESSGLQRGKPTSAQLLQRRAISRPCNGPQPSLQLAGLFALHLRLHAPLLNLLEVVLTCNWACNASATAACNQLWSCSMPQDMRVPSCHPCTDHPGSRDAGTCSSCACARCRGSKQQRTLELGVGVARGVERRPEEEADGAQEAEVEHVPEVAGDPVVPPLLVVLVRHLYRNWQCSRVCCNINPQSGRARGRNAP